MNEFIYDFEDGKFALKVSDNMAMGPDGKMKIRLAEHMAMDMESGDIHFVSGWSSFDSDDNDDF